MKTSSTLALLSASTLLATTAMADDHAFFESKIETANGHHRSLYLPIARTVQSEAIAIFDFSDHEKLTYRHAGRDFRLTDVHGRVVREIVG